MQQAIQEICRHVKPVFSPTAFYFAADPPHDALIPAPDSWTCLFSFFKQVQDGRAAAFSAERPGCAGAVSYFGFKELPIIPAALYLSHGEKLKKDASLAAAFYEEVQPMPAREPNLVFQRLDLSPEDAEIEVVNLWVGAASLALLHTLANYDRSANDNVIMPFSSGCQSIWTLPYKEKAKANPKAVAGSLDPTARPFLTTDVISFSAPAIRFMEMCGNIPGSFLSP